MLGTVPSTIDDIPELSKAPIPDDEQSIVSQVGHFGAVSESGLYVDTKWTGDRPINTVRTKIDLPYSTLQWQFGKSAKSRISLGKEFFR